MPATQGRTVFGLLGELVVAVDGEPREAAGPKVRLLLAMLAADPGRVVGTDSLVEELWGAPGVDDAGRLQAVVSRARRTLTGGSAIEFRSGGYTLAAAASTDVQRSAELARLGAEAETAGRHTAAEGHLRAALELHRGPAYAEFADREFFRAEAARLDEARLQLTERLAAALLATDRPAEAVAVLEPHVSAHPFRERAAAQLMTALHRCGRRADALAVYRCVRGRMAADLGLEPGPDLRRIEAVVLAENPDRAVPEGRMSHVPAHNPADSRRTVRRAECRAGGARRTAGDAAAGHSVGPGRGGQDAACRRDRSASGRRLCRRRVVRRVGLGGRTRTGWSGGHVGVGHARSSRGRRRCGPDPVSERASGPARARQLRARARRRGPRGARPTHRLPAGAAARHQQGTLLVPDEYVWPARSLALPTSDADLAELEACDAGALFLDRTRLAAPGSVVGEESASLVAEICRRLDEIPLALELAAARVRALGLQGVADRLDDQFALLVGGHRTADSRHRTMPGAIDWSVDLASADERELLSRLSVFPGSFDVAAAHAVSDAVQIGDTGDLLAQLVDRSLVTATACRYRLLEPIRQYAAEKTAEGDRTREVRARHVAHFAARVDGWWSRRSESDLGWGRWRADRHNFRAALEWALTGGHDAAAVRLASRLVPDWTAQDDPEDSALRWLERALPAARVADDLDAGLLFAALAWFRGDLPMAMHATDLLERSGNPRVRCFAAWSAGNVVARSDPSRGRTLLIDALETSIAVGSVAAAAESCRMSLAYVELALGDVSAARAQTDRLIADVSGSNEVTPLHWGLRALVLAFDGDHELAELAAQQALATASFDDLATMRALALLRAATVSALAGGWTIAAERLVELVVLLRRLGTQRWVRDTLQIAAVVLGGLQRPSRVPQLLAAAERYRVLDETPGGTLPQIAVVVNRARETAQRAGYTRVLGDVPDRDAILGLALKELRAAAGNAP